MNIASQHHLPGKGGRVMVQCTNRRKQVGSSEWRKLVLGAARTATTFFTPKA
jgi:hypothetical protein